MFGKGGFFVGKACGDLQKASSLLFEASHTHSEMGSSLAESQEYLLLFRVPDIIRETVDKKLNSR